MESYTSVAGIYDDINKDVPYSHFADFYEECFRRYMNEKPTLVLDLACGTGKITEELDRRGYDMTGIDLSPDMLMIAKDRAYNSGRSENILYLCQDMTEFELYGTVDAAICTLDGMNYLTEDGEIEKTLSLVHNYLIPDGIFIFDMSSRYRYENVYAKNTFTYDGETDGYKYFCSWQNMYDRDSELCEFSLTVFSELDGGKYIRESETQYQRMYSCEHVEGALADAGFELLSVCSDFDFSPLGDKDERMFFVARCKK